MQKKHHQQLADQFREAAATFVSTWSNRKSLITITRAELAERGDTVTFMVSIFPEESEGPAMGFLLRKRGECRDHIKKLLPIKNIPHIEFQLDEGEKNRRRVDELLQE